MATRKHKAGNTARWAVRGRLLSFRDDPALAGEAASARYIEDGLVVMRDGLIDAVGEAAKLLPELPRGVAIDDHAGRLVMPGFIDTHIHYPQAGVIASYGTQLLEWLEAYTFPEEAKFSNAAYAAGTAEFFLDELARNGTTTAAVYCTVHEASVEAFFAAAEAHGLRMIAGKALMDRNAAENLRDDVASGIEASRRLAEKWHGRGRLAYALTPRFAITSSPEQLAACGALLRDMPDIYMQTHLAENRAEVEEVRRLFPEAASYTDVYDRAGLLGPRSIFGHGIHLDESELRRLRETSSVIAFCPSSNLFMGSGLFDLARATARERPVRVGLATDVGAGTSYSMLRTAGDAYKVLQLQGQNLTAFQAFYMMTLGNARALSLEGRIGALEPGREADIVVLDAEAVPALRHRVSAGSGELAEELFGLMTLADDRAVRATYIGGALWKGPAGAE